MRETGREAVSDDVMASLLSLGERRLRQRIAEDRIWPLRLPWIMSQRWGHLLYLHYRVGSDELQGLVPEPLGVDEFEGSAWVSVIPLLMMNVHLRDLMPIPGAATFPEINVRTYVVYDNVPGVFFLSIDAASRMATFIARSSFRLPYHAATMSIEHVAGEFHHMSVRPQDASARFEAIYHPTGRAVPTDSGSLERFLAERYCMYAIGRSGRLLRGDISHLPWAVESVEATIHRNDLLEVNGVTPLAEPIMSYSVGSDSYCWPVRSASVPQRIWPRR